TGWLPALRDSKDELLEALVMASQRMLRQRLCVQIYNIFITKILMVYVTYLKKVRRAFNSPRHI
ncbi:MAG: hypothetical protein ACJARF_002391, partial [Alteromonadaceae bacterium]